MNRLSKTTITSTFFLAVILSALFIGNMTDNLQALGRILTMEGILLSDAIGINRGYGGVLNGLLLNTFITVGVALLIVKATKVPFEGAIIAGIFTIAGFSFVGKNIWNVLPIYLGVFLYTRFIHDHLKNHMIPLLFGTAISPLVSYLLFGAGMLHIDFALRLALAIAGGITAGFFAPMIAVQAAKFHGGFNLYNIGFTMGLVAVIAHGVLRSTGIHVQFVAVPIAGFPDITLFIMSTTAIGGILAIAYAFKLDKTVIEKYKLILKQTGQAPSNFSQSAGQPAVLLNMGIMTLQSLLLIVPMLYFLDIPFLGVFGASTFTIIGFAAFGKHPLNTLPIILGTSIGFAFVRHFDSAFLLINPSGNPYGPYYSALNLHVYVSAVFFATCMAPIAKEFGWKAGVITGFVHMTIVMTVRSFQGGFNLYNNGWAAGFIAGILVPIFLTFKNRAAIKAPITNNSKLKTINFEKKAQAVSHIAKK